MTKKEKALLACEALEKIYPDVECSLNFTKPYELMIATRLSAQCTDARVNIVTETLFKKYPTLESFAEADLSELEEVVKPCGFYHTKAKSIKEMANQLINDFGGEIPDTIEQLVKLPGVGRKPANLIVGDLYGKPALVCDTHVIRVSGRLGLTDGTKDALKVEKQLAAIIKPDDRLMMCHRLVWHGRLVCSAAKPNCSECRLSGFCKFFSGTK